jgi:hypothetical protein
VVSDIQLIILGLVVGAPVLALAELVVSSAILISVLPNRGRDGCRVAEMVIVAIG